MIKRRKLFSIESGSPRQSEKANNAKAFFRVGTAYAVGATIGAGILMSVPALVVGALGGPGLTLYGGAVAAAAIYGGLSRGLSHLFGWGFDRLVNIEDVLGISQISMTDVRDHYDRAKSPSITGSHGCIIDTVSTNEKLIPDSQLVINGDPKKHRVTFAIRSGVGIILLNNPSQALLKCLNAGLVSMLNTDRRSDYLSEKIKGGYVINVKTSREGFALLIKQASRSGCKVNCITSDKLDENILTAKHFSEDDDIDTKLKKGAIIGGLAAGATGGLASLGYSDFIEKGSKTLKLEKNAEGELESAKDYFKRMKKNGKTEFSNNEKKVLSNLKGRRNARILGCSGLGLAALGIGKTIYDSKKRRD